MVNSVSERPAFGGEFICGDTVFWVGHRAHVELAHVLSGGKAFMFRGVTTEGETVDRWINGGEVLGGLIADPSRVDRLTFGEEARITGDIDAIYAMDQLPLVIGDDFDEGLLIQAVAETL